MDLFFAGQWRNLHYNIPLITLLLFFKFYASKATSAFASSILFVLLSVPELLLSVLCSKNARFAVSHVAAAQNIGFHSYIYLPVCLGSSTLCLMKTYIVQKWMAKISWFFNKFGIKNGWIKSRNIPERR